MDILNKDLLSRRKTIWARKSNIEEQLSHVAIGEIVFVESLDKDIAEDVGRILDLAHTYDGENRVKLYKVEIEPNGSKSNLYVRKLRDK